MAVWTGERDGRKGRYLDSPFCPLFFEDTEEGRKALSRQIDDEIRMAWWLLFLIGIGVCALISFFFLAS